MNTLQDLANATNYALEQHGMPKRKLSEIRQFVGNGIRNLISRSVVEGSNEEDIDKVLDSFKTYYAEHCKDNTNPYEGIIEILTELKEKGVHMAIVSNKIQSGVDNLHETWFKENISCAIGERENVLRKPAPDMVYIAMKELKANAEQCIYIGDSEIDVITAHNAGLPCICVLWGFRDKNILKKNYGKYFVSHPKEILDFIK